MWSGDEAPQLARTLKTVFGAVEVRPHEVRLQERDERYWLHVARVPSDP